MSIIRKILLLALSATVAAGLISCSGKTSSQSSETSLSGSTTHTQSTLLNETSEVSDTKKEEQSGKAVVVYFSCTGTTKGVAMKIASTLGCPAYEIVPSKPYSEEDLNYKNKKSRATKEQNDEKARPEIEGDISDWSSYDTVYIGYPIWFAKAPRILCTFVESHDFAGKKVIPFCTSGSSGIGSSATELEALTNNAGKWMPGTRFSSSVSSKDIAEWLDALKDTSKK
ncbi:MAG: flavodoxin [Clostridiales bacterium]|nr:flavodoxin [Clostridiales bacterium]